MSDKDEFIIQPQMIRRYIKQKEKPDEDLCAEKIFYNELTYEEKDDLIKCLARLVSVLRKELFRHNENLSYLNDKSRRDSIVLNKYKELVWYIPLFTFILGLIMGLIAGGLP